MAVRIEVQRVGNRGEPLPLPSYATSGSSGLDLRADVAVTLRPGQRALVPTGLALAVPAGHEAQVRPRSGLALRSGITCLNTPGTIDSEFKALYIEQARLIEAILKEGIRKKAIRSLRPDQTAFAISDIIRGVVTHRLMGWSKTRIAQDVDFIFDLIWKGIAAP